MLYEGMGMIPITDGRFTERVTEKAKVGSRAVNSRHSFDKLTILRSTNLVSYAWVAYTFPRTF